MADIHGKANEGASANPGGDAKTQAQPAGKDTADAESVGAAVTETGMQGAKHEEPWSNPSALLKDEILEEEDKRFILEDWARALKTILADDPEADHVRVELASVETALARIESAGA